MELSMLTVLIMVFVLACFIGYFVIWNVTPALHTPLMAVSNAISGIVIVGAILVAGTVVYTDAQVMGIELYKIIGFLAVFFASINIFGGFTVTRRMLAMFKSKSKPR
ncbi:MAG: proton-translocating transhydrogenase family protein [Pseudomonadota bacterium]|nr:proton-translocating transhydrogenase family protein [Pseudomonadota bacterium]